MKNKFGGVVVLALLVTVGLLAMGVANKMRKTAVSAQAIERPPAATTVSDSPSAVAPLAVFFGDFIEGSPDGGDGDKYGPPFSPRKLRKRCHCGRSSMQRRGSGYVVRGNRPTFSEQVRRHVTPDARVVAISGSRNDVVADPNEVTAAALETYSLVQSLAPRAKLIVIGPTWGNTEPTDQILQTRDSVRDAAASANAYFVDPILGRWFTDGEPGLIGSDHVHPTELANARIAEHLYPIFSQALSEDTG